MTKKPRKVFPTKLYSLQIDVDSVTIQELAELINLMKISVNLELLPKLSKQVVRKHFKEINPNTHIKYENLNNATG